ncbi:MAG TPA: tetratricopeptide repeat protein [Thiobacillus sp.]|nr:tetratricopeptide repeat protein [Thiobacillus sp.]HQT33514.1 tetratricopeptide repeat protein [Thiobacillus sp.]
MKYLWIIFFGLAAINQVNAATDTTPQDISMLPTYCDAKMGRQEPAVVAQWLRNMGRENWVHLHHYCGGLIEINRYYRGTTGRQKANLGNAVNEFKYVLERWTPDFYLRAEAHLNRGRAYKLMRQDGPAFADFQKALELNSRLAPASIELADIYIKQGKRDAALAVLKSGIESNPDTRSLRRRYTELGGDIKALNDPILVPQVETSPSSSAVPEVAESEIREEAETAIDVKPPVQLIEPKIGSPTNPYCRFCPD